MPDGLIKVSMPNFPLPAREVLPHAAPMLCIDALICASENSAEAEAFLAPGHILLHKGSINEAGYVELAAQTAGAMKGYAEKALGLPVRQGFLAAVQNFSVRACARRGDRLRIAVTRTAEVAGVSLLQAEITRIREDGARESLAGGGLKVFIPPQPLA